MFDKGKNENLKLGSSTLGSNFIHNKKFGLSDNLIDKNSGAENLITETLKTEKNLSPENSNPKTLSNKNSNHDNSNHENSNPEISTKSSISDKLINVNLGSTPKTSIERVSRVRIGSGGGIASRTFDRGRNLCGDNNLVTASASNIGKGDIGPGNIGPGNIGTGSIGPGDIVKVNIGRTKLPEQSTAHQRHIRALSRGKAFSASTSSITTTSLNRIATSCFLSYFLLIHYFLFVFYNFFLIILYFVCFERCCFYDEFQTLLGTQAD